MRAARLPSRLPADVDIEIRQVAHHGKAPQVRAELEAAGEAYEAERYEDALAAGLRAKRMAPRSPSVRETLGLAYYRLGRYREAARELTTYRRLSERRDEDHVLADCERALGRPDKALEVLAGVRRSEVGEELIVECLLVAAGALTDLGRLEDGVTLLKQGPVRPKTVRTYHLRLWYVLADALEQAGRRAEARGWWDLVYAEDPDFFDIARRRLRRERR